MGAGDDFRPVSCALAKVIQDRGVKGQTLRRVGAPADLIKQDKPPVMYAGEKVLERHDLGGEARKPRFPRGFGLEVNIVVERKLHAGTRRQKSPLGKGNAEAHGGQGSGLAAHVGPGHYRDGRVNGEGDRLVPASSPFHFLTHLGMKGFLQDEGAYLTVDHGFSRVPQGGQFDLSEEIVQLAQSPGRLLQLLLPLAKVRRKGGKHLAFQKGFLLAEPAYLALEPQGFAACLFGHLGPPELLFRFTFGSHP